MQDNSPISERDTVGSLIRRRRLVLGLTLESVARRAGCAKSYVSVIEAEKRCNPPTDKVLHAIERALTMPRGTLVAAAKWQQTPLCVRAKISHLEHENESARELVRLLTRNGLLGYVEDAKRGLDDLYQNCRVHEFVRSAEQIRLRDADPCRPRPETHNTVEVLAELPVSVPVLGAVGDGACLAEPAERGARVLIPDNGDADAFAARIVGDAMTPVYSPGDVVVFSPARPARDGDDCLVRLRGERGAVFARVESRSGTDGEAGLRLLARNRAYGERFVRRDDVVTCYPAVSVTRAVAGARGEGHLPAAALAE